MEYLICFGLVFIGFSLGKLYAEVKIAKQIRDALLENGIDIEAELAKRDNEEITEHVRKLTVEQHNETLYLYDRDNNDFVCQGKTIEELAQLSKEYKNITHGVVLYNNKVFMFVNGLSEEYIA